MIRRPPRTTITDTHVPSTTLFRSVPSVGTTRLLRERSRVHGWIWPQILSHRAVAEPDRESLWAEQLNPRQLPCPHPFCDERPAHGQARVRSPRHRHRDESEEKLCRPPTIALARSEEHTSELHALLPTLYALFRLKQKIK